MLTLAYHGAGALALEHAPDPVPGPGEVRVRVGATGLCMSDVYGIAGVNDRRDAVLGDGDVLVMGHEVAGVVDACGPGTRRLEPGTPVAVDPIVGCGHCARCAAGEENGCAQRAIRGCLPDAPGGYAEALVVPERNLHALAPGTPLELGALAEPLAVGAHGVALADPAPAARVLVIGGGIVGLGAALAAQRRLADPDAVLVVEPRPERRALCERLGLRAVAPAASGADASGLEPGSFDVALDCVARPETFAAAVEAVRAQGLVVLVGIWADEIPLPVSRVVWRETRIVGSFGYTRADFADVVAWIGSGERDLTPIVQGRVGFDGLAGALRGYADGSVTAVRTVFRPDLDEERR